MSSSVQPASRSAWTSSSEQSRLLGQLDREIEHRPLPRLQLRVPVVRPQLLDEEGIAGQLPQRGGVRDHAVVAAVRRRDDDRDHLPLRLRQPGVAAHQVVVERGPELEVPGPERVDAQDVRDEPELLQGQGPSSFTSAGTSSWRVRGAARSAPSRSIRATGESASHGIGSPDDSLLRRYTMASIDPPRPRFSSSTTRTVSSTRGRLRVLGHTGAGREARLPGEDRVGARGRPRRGDARLLRQHRVAGPASSELKKPTYPLIELYPGAQRLHSRVAGGRLAVPEDIEPTERRRHRDQLQSRAPSRTRIWTACCGAMGERTLDLAGHRDELGRRKHRALRRRAGLRHPRARGLLPGPPLSNSTTLPIRARSAPPSYATISNSADFVAGLSGRHEGSRAGRPTPTR